MICRNEKLYLNPWRLHFQDLLVIYLMWYVSILLLYSSKMSCSTCSVMLAAERTTAEFPSPLLLQPLLSAAGFSVFDYLLHIVGSQQIFFWILGRSLMASGSFLFISFVIIFFIKLPCLYVKKFQLCHAFFLTSVIINIYCKKLCFC